MDRWTDAYTTGVYSSRLKNKNMCVSNLSLKTIGRVSRISIS